MDEIEAFLDECRADPWFHSHPEVVDRLESVLTKFYFAGEGPEWQAIWDQVHAVLERHACRAVSGPRRGAPGRQRIGSRHGRTLAPLPRPNGESLGAEPLGANAIRYFEAVLRPDDFHTSGRTPSTAAPTPPLADPLACRRGSRLTGEGAREG
jgi:hypothetical protein